MKSKITFFFAVLVVVVAAACTSKPTESTSEVKDSVAAEEVPAPVVESDTTVTTDTTAVQH